MATSKDVEAGMTGPPPAYDISEGNQPVMSHTETPPSYSATHPTQDMAPPPSYESLYGKMKAAKQESEGNMDFCKKFFIILLSTVGCTIMLAVVLAIPITMIIIGAIYKNDCPAERMIPIYLIVAGSFGIVKNLSSLVQRCKNRNEEDSDEQNAKTNPFDATLNCFLFAWFIAGNVWIYRTNGDYDPNDTTASDYCDPTLYLFAFWVTTATYILIGTVCCCVCFGGIMAACCGALSGEK